jgi:hypothetical protein
MNARIMDHTHNKRIATDVCDEDKLAAVQDRNRIKRKKKNFLFESCTRFDSLYVTFLVTAVS